MNEEEKHRFASGDKVFAKLKGYPHWPARIIGLTNETSNNKKYHVHFYGTNQTAVVKGENICLYVENKSKYGKPRKYKYFTESLIEIEAELDPLKDLKELEAAFATSKSSSNTKKQKRMLINSECDDVKVEMELENNAFKKPKSSLSVGTKKKVVRNSANSVLKGQLKGLSITGEDSGDACEKSVHEPSKVLKDKVFRKEEKRKQDYIVASVSEMEDINIPLSLNRPDFADRESEVVWNDMVLLYANTIKNRLESGETVGDTYQIMNEWTAMKSLDFDKHSAAQNLEKIIFLQTESQLLDIDVEIKRTLNLEKAVPHECVILLDKLDELTVTALMLKKQPHIVTTIRRMRNYVGNTPSWKMNEEEKEQFNTMAGQIRVKAELLYNKFKCLFDSRQRGNFWRFFKEEIKCFREKTSGLTLKEFLALVEEPVSEFV